MAHFLELYIGNITLIIEWLFIVILGLVSVYLFYSIREDKVTSNGVASLSASPELESLLKRALEGAGRVAAAAGEPVALPFKTKKQRRS
jgi:hypothetical protein